MAHMITLSDLEARLARNEALTSKHQTILLEGNGKPALTVRVAVVEECVEKISRNLNRGVWLLVAILATAVADFFVKLH